jgi:hypothetical protein
MPANGLSSAPINATRFHSLVARGGDDDFFSSDFSRKLMRVRCPAMSHAPWVTCACVCSAAYRAAEEARERLGHVRVPALVVLSAADEYVPITVDTAALGLTLLASFAPLPPPGDGTAPDTLRRVITLDGADHALSSDAAAAEFVVETVAFAKSACLWN